MADLPLIEGHLRSRLLDKALLEAPNEAAGIIYRNEVYSLGNTSESPGDSFEVDLSELRLLFEALQIDLGSAAQEVFFWHSHPSGGVGPSRIDMQRRTPLEHHLVIALVEGDIVPTWY